MKKFICIILVITLLFALSACGSTSNETANNASADSEAEPLVPSADSDVVHPEDKFRVEKYEDRFVYLGMENATGTDIIYKYDRFTNIVYYYEYHRAGYSGGAVGGPLFNADGSYVTYEQFVAQYKGETQ